MLLRDKLENVEVTDRGGERFKLTQARWQKFIRLLKQYEGWASAMRADYGHETITFLEESQILDEAAGDAEAVIELLKKPDHEGEPYETELLDEDPMELRVRTIERKTGSASTHRLRRDLFSTGDYRNFVRVHGELRALAGTPPFDVRLAKKEDKALSFEDLRRAVLDVCKDGVPLQRFKGLGEMNPDQLFDTTMDPVAAHAPAGLGRRRQRGRPDLLDADGRAGRAPARLHREARTRCHQPGCVGALDPF